MTTFKEENIYFIDEAGFSLSMRNRRGRAPKGHRTITTVPGIRFKNISVCTAMNLNGVKKFQIETSAFNSAKFSSFMKEFCTNLKSDGVFKALLVMDNVPFHKTQEVRQVIREMNDITIRIIYLPPYSPFLNPIKNVLSKWKQLVRQKQSSTEAKLLKHIRKSLKKITSKNCRNFYRYMLQMMKLCIDKLPILDE